MPVQQNDINEHWVWPLVEMGLTVFPLGTVGEYPPHWAIERAGGVEKAKQQWPKQPRGSWKEWQRSKPTDAQVTQWLMQHPDCNFAIATGKEIDVVDADDEAAIDWVRENLTRTPWVVKTGKGAHFYYQTNEKLKLKNSADEHAKLDTRGFGGYVVAPGSHHPSGARYALEIDPAWPVDNIKDLPCLSADDLAKIQGHKQAQIGGVGGNLAGFNAATFAPPAQGGVAEGGRNNNMARLVGAWVQQGYSIDQVMARAVQENQRNTPPMTDAEVATIVHSVIGTHMRGMDPATVATEQAPEPSGLLLKLSDLKITPPRWLIKSVLPMDGIGILFGPSGLGKSFAVLDLALSVASGRDWHGRKVKHPGGVIYVCGEGKDGIGNRVRAWEKHTGVAIDGLPMRITKVPIRFLDPASVSSLLEAIEGDLAALGGVALIIIDTLNRNFGDGDENSTKDMTRFVDAVTDIQKSLNTTMLIVHHTGLQAQDRARGASSLRASIDFEIQHKATEGGDEDQFTLVGQKMKDGSKMPETHFTLKPVVLGVDEDGEEFESLVTELAPGDAIEGAQIAAGLTKKLGENEQKMLKILSDHKRKLLTNRPDLTEIIIERKELIQALKTAGIPRNKTSRQIDTAVGKKWILPTNGVLFLVSELIE